MPLAADVRVHADFAKRWGGLSFTVIKHVYLIIFFFYFWMFGFVLKCLLLII